MNACCRIAIVLLATAATAGAALAQTPSVENGTLDVRALSGEKKDPGA